MYDEKHHVSSFEFLIASGLWRWLLVIIIMIGFSASLWKITPRTKHVMRFLFLRFMHGYFMSLWKEEWFFSIVICNWILFCSKKEENGSFGWNCVFKVYKFSSYFMPVNTYMVRERQAAGLNMVCGMMKQSSQRDIAWTEYYHSQKLLDALWYQKPQRIPLPHINFYFILNWIWNWKKIQKYRLADATGFIVHFCTFSFATFSFVQGT